ncbi:EF-hand domain-containing protein [Vibrio fluvialis]|uniref:EF-hand domain-containing protein n=1 Tax=Vibrio fluvialis TaxID=676 RepID=UPI00155869C8|nr:EF-hand domain-containing protein [Vibrio fluvialis]EKO3368490.1 EF-hand domain-containing protein [Vibrio fluvialis]ELW1731638.1 EF-hand domain-containing protein [Vibrio fluvialis]MBY7906409.1 EF-hand domain-containing protein [Vibrio fluvialis]MBY8176457.1 EF-hand domain-containing protein [Vibrio fluvialis]MBY8198103.1 EF-hand domain-containing protein [Vibrio fluvialis]
MKSVSLFALLGCALLSTSTMAQDQPSGRPDMWPPPSFSDMDSNGDGVLTQDEVQGPMQRDFSSMDTNNDGQLTETEVDTFMKNHKPPQRPNNDE